MLVRVDCRLIHGQIIEAWVPHTRTECLVVANDEAAQDPLTRSIMEMAVPPSIELAVLAVRDAAETLTAGKWAEKRTMVLVADCKDALTLYKTGLNFDRLNLGNLICTPGKKQVTCFISLDTADVGYIREFQDHGIHVEARPVPRDPSRNMAEVLEPCLGG
ncbi:MAG: PTS sugar transporter subunit IIB [Thermodesulfobacteriota bacterium]